MLPIDFVNFNFLETFHVKKLILAATLSAFTMTAMAAPQTQQPVKPKTEQATKKQVKKTTTKKGYFQNPVETPTPSILTQSLILAKLGGK